MSVKEFLGWVNRSLTFNLGGTIQWAVVLNWVLHENWAEHRHSLPLLSEREHNVIDCLMPLLPRLPCCISEDSLEEQNL